MFARPFDSIRRFGGHALALAALVALVSVAAEATAEDSLFTTPALEFGTGAAPSGVAVGDLDGDQIPDLVVANASGNSVSVLLGHGDGSFAAKTDYGSTSIPRSVALADFDHDGRLDIALANEYDASVMLLFGNGDGTFSGRRFLFAGGRPVSVRSVDLNADGHFDILVANVTDNTISVLLGQGDRTFEARVAHATAGRPTEVEVGDFNGDGVPDLAASCGYVGIVCPSQDLTLLLGTGDGSFAPGITVPVGFCFDGVAQGDLNRDGVPDLVVELGSGLAVMLGQGDGTFQPRQFESGAAGPGMVLANLDGDAALDLVAAGLGLSTAFVSRGLGDGTFGPIIHYGAPAHAEAVAVADLDDDGRPDLVLTDGQFNCVRVLLNTGASPGWACRPAIPRLRDRVWQQLRVPRPDRAGSRSSWQIGRTFGCSSMTSPGGWSKCSRAAGGKPAGTRCSGRGAPTKGAAFAPGFTLSS